MFQFIITIIYTNTNKNNTSHSKIAYISKILKKVSHENCKVFYKKNYQVDISFYDNEKKMYSML